MRNEVQRKLIALLITTDKYKNHIENIVSSAVKSGCEVRCFIMDDGVNLLNDEDYVSKLKESHAGVSLCEYSCEVRNVTKKVDGFTYASQYENASMMNDLELSDRLLVF